MATGESSTATASRTGSVTRERLGGRTSGGSRISRDGSARAMVNDQISQAVVSTSNLIHLMLQSSPSQAHLIKLPKNLLAKTSTIKNTEQVLEQLPKVVASLDEHMENGLQRIFRGEFMETLDIKEREVHVLFKNWIVPHLKTVTQLLTNIETCQLNSLSKAQLSSGDPEQVHQPGGAG